MPEKYDTSALRQPSDESVFSQLSPKSITLMVLLFTVTSLMFVLGLLWLRQHPGAGMPWLGYAMVLDVIVAAASGLSLFFIWVDRLGTKHQPTIESEDSCS